MQGIIFVTFRRGFVHFPRDCIIVKLLLFCTPGKCDPLQKRMFSDWVARVSNQTHSEEHGRAQPTMNPIKTLKDKLKSKLRSEFGLEAMYCVGCSEVARSLPLFRCCANGTHTICSDCKSHVSSPDTRYIPHFLNFALSCAQCKFRLRSARFARLRSPTTETSQRKRHGQPRRPRGSPIAGTRALDASLSSANLPPSPSTKPSAASTL